VNADEIADLVPRLLEARYPGRSQRASFGELPPGLQDPGGWVLQLDGVFCFVRATRTTDPFIWMQCGIAHAIPRSNELAFYVAAANKKLSIGRLFMAYGADLAMVVLDETIFAHAISMAYQPSIQDLVNRLEGTITTARESGAEVLERFGGRPFAFEDWMMLTL
jgi:hypothetical protein